MKNLRFTTLTRESGNMQALCVTIVMFLPFDITEKLSNFSPILDEMSCKYNVFFFKSEYLDARKGSKLSEVYETSWVV